jgi:hypothetical protein
MLFQYLYGQPIQMTVYGHSLTYGTIGKKYTTYLLYTQEKIATPIASKKVPY